MWLDRALKCFQNCILHRYKSVGSSAIWEVKPKHLPALSASVTDQLQTPSSVLTSMRESRMGQAVPAGWTGQWLIHGITVVPFKSASALLSTASYTAVALTPGSWQKGYHWSFIIPTQGNCRCFQGHTHFWTGAGIFVGFGNSLGQRERIAT